MPTESATMATLDKAAILAEINGWSSGTLMATLGIEYTDCGEDFLEARMPVSKAVYQPMGILHGGATAALAESVGSAASCLRLDLSREVPVGVELSITHLRKVRTGEVVARATLVHGGRSLHVWEINIHDQDHRKVAWSRLLMKVIPKPADAPY